MISGMVDVYGLVDPRTSLIRYVGRSADIGGRLSAHMAGASAPAVQEWIAELAVAGLKPAVTVLRQVPECQAAEAEREEIALRHEILLNVQHMPPDFDLARSASRSSEMLFGGRTPRRRGAFALANALQVVSQTQIADAVRCGQARISLLLNEKCDPSLRVAVALRDTLGIEVDWWLLPAPGSS